VICIKTSVRKTRSKFGFALCCDMEEEKKFTELNQFPQNCGMQYNLPKE
jgi:hypothetical protein